MALERAVEDAANRIGTWCWPCEQILNLISSARLTSHLLIDRRTVHLALSTTTTLLLFSSLLSSQLPRHSPLPAIQRSQGGYSELVNVSVGDTFDSLCCCRAGRQLQQCELTPPSHTTARSPSFFSSFQSQSLSPSRPPSASGRGPLSYQFTISKPFQPVVTTDHTSFTSRSVPLPEQILVIEKRRICKCEFVHPYIPHQHALKGVQMRFRPTCFHSPTDGVPRPACLRESAVGMYLPLPQIPSSTVRLP